MQRKYNFIFLVLVILMGQGSLFVHDMNHTPEEEVSDCLLCNKLDKQEHALPETSLLEFTALRSVNAALSPVTKPVSNDWHFCQCRAPPATV